MNDFQRPKTPEQDAVEWAAVIGLLAGLGAYLAGLRRFWLVYPLFRQIALLAYSAWPRLPFWRWPQAPCLVGAVLVGFLALLLSAAVLLALSGGPARRMQKRAEKLGAARQEGEQRRHARKDFFVR